MEFHSVVAEHFRDEARLLDVGVTTVERVDRARATLERGERPRPLVAAGVEDRPSVPGEFVDVGKADASISFRSMQFLEYQRTFNATQFVTLPPSGLDPPGSITTPWSEIVVPAGRYTGSPP